MITTYSSRDWLFLEYYVVRPFLHFFTMTGIVDCSIEIWTDMSD